MSTIEKALKKRKDGDLSSGSEENIAYMPGVDPVSVEVEDLSPDQDKAIAEDNEPYIDFSVDDGASENIGQLLVEAGKLTEHDVEKILKLQEKKDLFFGDAAIKLRLLTASDINRALAKQFSYNYVSEPPSFVSQELVIAHRPFSKQAESIRNIRSQILAHYSHEEESHVLAVVSPNSKEGRSYIAANLAVAFSQMGKRTLLIDADLRRPRQHTMFGFGRKLGLSTMLAGRVEADAFSELPNSFSHFPNLAVLGAGAMPPNPSELLAHANMKAIVSQISKYFDMVILDSPAGKYKSDVQSVATAAGAALLVTRRDKTSLVDTKELVSNLNRCKVSVVGAILNEF